MLSGNNYFKLDRGTPGNGPLGHDLLINTSHFLISASNLFHRIILFSKIALLFSCFDFPAMSNVVLKENMADADRVN